MLKQDQKSEVFAWKVCVCEPSGRDVKLLNTLRRSRSVMVSLLPTKTLTINGDTRLGQFGIPALLWLPVVQGLLPFNFILQSVRVNGRRLSQNRQDDLFFTSFLHCCRNLQISRKGKGQLPIHSFCTGYGDGYFHCFSGPLSDLLWSG